MSQSAPSRFKLIHILLATSLLGAGAMANAEQMDLRRDKVFSMSNDVAHNALLVFELNKNGRNRGLRQMDSVDANGQGTGSYLGSQSALSLSTDHRHLYLVNAGSNSISAFDIGRRDIKLSATLPSGGSMPISVAEHDGLVYVLNHGGDGGVSGFRQQDGMLTPITGSKRSIATSSTNPAQVGFSPDGDYLVVSQRGNSTLLTYPVLEDGTLGAALETASNGAVPFGFSFDKHANLLVTEAAGSALSSYRLDEDTGGMPLSISASIKDMQTAACWIAITPNSHFAYVANTPSNNISGYRVSHDGKLSLLSSNGISAVLPGGSLPADMSVGNHGKSLFVLDRGVGEIAEFSIQHNGSLQAASQLRGLPAGVTGLIAN